MPSPNVFSFSVKFGILYKFYRYLVVNVKLDRAYRVEA